MVMEPQCDGRRYAGPLEELLLKQLDFSSLKRAFVLQWAVMSTLKVSLGVLALQILAAGAFSAPTATRLLIGTAETNITPDEPVAGAVAGLPSARSHRARF